LKGAIPEFRIQVLLSDKTKYVGRYSVSRPYVLEGK